MAKKKFKYTPEEIKEHYDEYYSRVADSQYEFPDIDGFKIRFDIDEDEWEEMAKSDEYKKVIDYTIRKRRSWLQREVAKGNKNINGLLKLLMQPENGGIIDKPIQEDYNQEIIVHFET